MKNTTIIVLALILVAAVAIYYNSRRNYIKAGERRKEMRYTLDL